MSVFACLHEAQSFLEQHPHIEMFELFILDNNGVPRGKLLHRDELLAVYESGRPPSTSRAGCGWPLASGFWSSR